jgi:hypothetical protein
MSIVIPSRIKSLQDYFEFSYCILSAASFVQAINARRYKFHFGDEYGYTRRYSLCGLGPNGDEYSDSDFGSVFNGGDSKDIDTHWHVVEADLELSFVESEAFFVDE